MAESVWTVAGWGTAIVAVIGFFSLLIRQVGPWRQQISDAEHRIRDALESALEKEREAHSADLERERLARAAEARTYALERDEMGDRIARLERQIQRQQAMHKAEVGIARHRLNNVTQCFDALLLLLKASPEKAGEAVVMIEAMRSQQLLAESEEKAIIRAAELAQFADEDDPDKSDALNTVEHTERDAKQTLRSAKAARREVERAEGDDK